MGCGRSSIKITARLPSNTELLNNLGMMLLQKGQLEEGVKILDSMLYVLVVLSGKFQDSCFAAGSESMSQARIVY